MVFSPQVLCSDAVRAEGLRSDLTKTLEYQQHLSQLRQQNIPWLQFAAGLPAGRCTSRPQRWRSIKRKKTCRLAEL